MGPSRIGEEKTARRFLVGHYATSLYDAEYCHEGAHVSMTAITTRYPQVAQAAASASDAGGIGPRERRQHRAPRLRASKKEQRWRPLWSTTPSSFCGTVSPSVASATRPPTSQKRGPDSVKVARQNQHDRTDPFLVQ